jgi:hypothetical protein
VAAVARAKHSPQVQNFLTRCPAALRQECEINSKKLAATHKPARFSAVEGSIDLLQGNNFEV